MVVVLDRKPTAKTGLTWTLTYKSSCYFTHLVAHALDLGAIEGAFGVRAAHLEVVLTRRIEIRDVGVGRRRLDGRRAAAIVRRGARGCLEAGRVGGLFRPPRRGRRGERGKRRRERRSLLSRRRVGSRKRRADRGGERRGRGLEPAVDVREVRGGRAREQEYRRVSRRSRRRRPSGGGRPRGGGRVEQSRGPPSESKRQAREHATAGEVRRGRREGGLVELSCLAGVCRWESVRARVPSARGKWRLPKPSSLPDRRRCRAD